ncbi:hypothetical protein PC116_g7914 [Phytophthora cactorum]|uniref:Uncharacterized protein n=1 Tax=Phytophthora cactorum TaxID=29920 RepID=A0A8T1L807_9STRA|nr:hypothetical protein PC114_g7533 [Phytophthora cactorum]KAG2946582.1 hypothetical protein PC117_g7513 [Phytophthora cactorum]KAG4244249.1 hypothetical protein PC116_g7914 [Phytophthora cactorum]
MSDHNPRELESRPSPQEILESGGGVLRAAGSSCAGLSGRDSNERFRIVTRSCWIRKMHSNDVSDVHGSEAETEEWNGPKSPFRPSFGGNSDDSAQQRQTVNPIRVVPQQLKKSLFSSESSAPRSSDIEASLSEPLLSDSQKSISSHIKAKWQEVYQQIVFKRHEEILAKDPNRKWRQERFGLLLFAKREYARASEHLSKAISLGATSSLCWRRLAESYHHMWEDGGEWEILWACRAAYEQALTHVAVACSPLALLAYAKVLESLGSFTGALTICASILQTFPNFDQLREVKLRFVLLQRYQLFSSSTDPATKRPVLTKCIGYTQELLLDKVITEGPRYINVMYLHTRLSEMLDELSAHSLAIPKTKLVHVNVDILFQELYKLATKTSEVAPPAGIKWKAWKSRSETYTAFAEYFRAQGESVLASDALSRSLELLEESDSSQKPANRWRGLTEEQRYKRAQLYVVLARNYYQCNQMEKAIRSMEAVFDLDPLHAEARASLVEWFPTKWKYRLELEDASQVQIARVLRGIWGRKIALTRRREAKRIAEQRYRENPYHLGCRRLVLRLLRDKYGSLFAAQEMAARCIQRRAHRYLHYARKRWKIEDQRDKTLHNLKSKYQTRKYRYNRQVRSQLAVLLPNEYEYRFFREDCAALRIQRCFRGYRTRKLIVLSSPPSSPAPHHKRQLSPMQLLSKALCTSNFLLEELYLERNELLRKPQEGAIVAEIVADYFFARYGHLHTLVIAHMHFSDASGALLGAALAINSVLENLDLHGNLLCDGAAVAIANDGLAHNKTLRYLNLAENRIGSSGGKALFRCLSSHNRSLQTLILRNNYLMNDVVSVLIGTWQVNAAIESVELAGNLISDRFVAEIESAAMERLEVSQSTDNHQLRLLLARKRFGIRDSRSVISRKVIGIFSTPFTSPGKSRDCNKTKKSAPLSPKKWLSANTPKIISPIAFPTSTNRQANEVLSTATFPLDKVYAFPVRPRKLMKGVPLSPARLSKLPALSAPLEKKRLAW